jgi:hypothetical protein
MKEIVVDLRRVYDPTRNLKQLMFHKAPHRYKLFGGAMGGGKTAALINEAIQLSLDYPNNFGLLLRKTWPSFRDTVLPQFEKFLPLELVEKWNQTEKIITLKNKSRIRYGGLGDNPKQDWKKFMSGEYGFIAIDQVEEFTEEEINMLSTRLRLKLPNIRHYFLMTCNPSEGWLKERFIERNLEDHIFIPSLPEDNRANLPPDYIEKMKNTLPENLQRAFLKGDWSALSEAKNHVYDYTFLREAMSREVERGRPISIGVDVARSGSDETVIAVREGLKAEIFSITRGHDTMRTVGEVWRCVYEFLIPHWGRALSQFTVKVDADGLGAGVVDRLKEQKSEKEQMLNVNIKIIEIHGSARASAPAQFRNLRAEIHWGLREVLPLISMPNDHELLAQFMAITYNINSTGQIEIIPKEEIKKRLGRSPDRAEAIIYAFAETRETRRRKSYVYV